MNHAHCDVYHVQGYLCRACNWDGSSTNDTDTDTIDQIVYFPQSYKKGDSCLSCDGRETVFITVSVVIVCLIVAVIILGRFGVLRRLKTMIQNVKALAAKESESRATTVVTGVTLKIKLVIYMFQVPHPCNACVALNHIRI